MANMQGLDELYAEIMTNRNRWSYYENLDFLADLRPEYLCNGPNAYDFIKRYFAFAGKANVFAEFEYQDMITHIRNRACHIISTFLLGVRIAEIFKFYNEKKDKEGFNFRYYWFLACLFHDIGYAYENRRSCREIDRVKEKGFEALREICSIKYLKDDDRKRIFKTYGENIVELYFKERANDEKVKIDGGAIEHGIIGGLILYDRLRKNYDRAKEVCGEKKDSFVYKGLHFAKSDCVVYGKVADAIIVHNIWLSTLRDYMKYSFNYDARVIKRNTGRPHIKYQNNMSIAFVLAIADTLEPIKSGIPLRNIKIGEMEERKGIRIEIDRNFMGIGGVTAEDAIDSYKKAIIKLKEWVAVTVDEPVADTLRIVIAG